MNIPYGSTGSSSLEIIRDEIIKVLVDALRKYSEKSNWSRTQEDFDRFGLRGDGFETAQQALEEAYRIIKEENEKQSKVVSPTQGTIGQQFPVITTTDSTNNNWQVGSSKYAFKKIIS